MKMWTAKQEEIIAKYVKQKPKILVLYGAMRSGKTFLAVFLFAAIIKAKQGQGLTFIIGGTSQGTIQRNVLDPLEQLLGQAIRLDRFNSFELFGNRVLCLDGGDSASWKKARGFTAAGAYINEATALHDRYIKEVLARCSERDSRVIMDTNPDNPSHPVKVDYIDKSGEKLSTGRTNILAFHFSIFDNDTLDKEYIESMMLTTPAGMYTERNIYGKWVAASGAVYPDFSDDNFYVGEEINQVRTFAGVDWGYEHKGVIAIYQLGDDGVFYRVTETVKQHQDIKYWVQVAKSYQEEYGDIPFYCDTARPEYLAEFVANGIRAQGAIKDVMPGIGYVARLIKTRSYKVNKNDCEGFLSEIYQYVFDEKADSPVKKNDDCMDTDRYALYTDYILHTRSNQSASDKSRKAGFIF